MKIHCIGIGGIGMSGLAKILLVRGDVISGSDQAACDFPGAVVGHAAANVPEGVELVVRSAAIKDDNAEVVEARTPERPGPEVRRDARPPVDGQVDDRDRRLPRQDHDDVDDLLHPVARRASSPATSAAA